MGIQSEGIFETIQNNSLYNIHPLIIQSLPILKTYFSLLDPFSYTQYLVVIKITQKKCVLITIRYASFASQCKLKQ